MSWDNIESRWVGLQASARKRWTRLTDEQLTAIGGQRDKLAMSIRQAYGIRMDQVEIQMKAFETFHADDEATLSR